MPERIVPVVDLQPSTSARRLRGLARLLAAVSALSCLWILLLAPDGARVAGALAALGGAGLLWRPQRRPVGRQLRIGPDGCLSVGAAETGFAAARPVFCNRRFVALKTRDETLALLPDMVPADAWRRLQVACRWLGGGDAAEPPAESAAGDRTK